MVRVDEPYPRIVLAVVLHVGITAPIIQIANFGLLIHRAEDCNQGLRGCQHFGAAGTRQTVSGKRLGLL